MIYFVAPDFKSFISGGNVFNNQIYNALLDLEKPVKQICYPLEPEYIIGKDDILIVDSIFINDLDSSQLIGLPCKKYFICHFLPSMIGKGRGKYYELKILELFDTIIVNSHFCFEILLNMGVSKGLIIIEPFIDQFFNISPGDQNENALIIANWLPSKQIDQFLLCLTKEKSIPISITIIGSTGMDPFYFKGCSRIISNSQELTHKIRILGEVDRKDTQLVLANSGLLLDCSAFETYGMAVAEAVAIGVPVLTLGNGNITNIVSTTSICTSLEEMVTRLINHNWPSAISNPKVKLITEWDAFLDQFRASDKPLF